MNKQQLYNLVFNDGLEYTDFYFNKRRKKVLSFEKIIDANTVGLVNIIDINMQLGNNNYKTALITGVCTSPNMRKIGIMQELLNNTLEQLKEDKYQIAILSPVNNNYYKKYGFTTLVKANKEVIKYIPNANYHTKKASKIDINLLLNLYKSIAYKYDNYQIIDKDNLLDLFDEYEIDNTDIQIVYNHNLPIGWYIAESGKVEIAILPDLNILNHIEDIDGFNYYKQDLNGEKELFQIRILDNKIKEIKLNTTFVLNKY